jgi:hypothetical protein
MLMQSIPMRARARRIEPKSTPSFEVVLAYQDFNSGIRAKEFFDRLVREHGKLFRFLCHLWKFDFLLAPGLTGQAVANAADADMIVIAANNQTELPLNVKDWIHLWLPLTRPSGALVALLDGDKPSVGSRIAVCSYLREVAERAHMEFFSHKLGSLEAAAPVAVKQPQSLERTPGWNRERLSTITSRLQARE